MTNLKSLISCAGLLLLASLPVAAQEAKRIDLGAAVTAVFANKEQKDVWVFDAEDGAAYDITVVDGYNSGALKDAFPLKNPIRATMTQVMKSLEPSLAYEPSIYSALNDDKSGGWTPEKASGPVARIKAAGTKVYVIVVPDSKKNSYPGEYGLKVVKQ